MELIVVGCNQETAPAKVREALAHSREESGEALRIARNEAGLDEAMLLSTCNRTEFYAVASDLARAKRSIRALFLRIKGADLGEAGYVHHGREAVRHLFRVVSGADSMSLGEMQIAGQVKDAYELARELRSTGVILDRLLPAAFHAGKRVRTETRIGTGAVSVPSSAVHLARKVFGDLSRKRVLVLGAGEAGRIVAEHFAERRPAGLLVLNRTEEKARALAAAVGGTSLPWAALPEALGRSDVVVSATRSSGLVVSSEMVRRAQRERGSDPLLIVDLAAPRDVDPEAGELPNVFLYTLDSLREVLDANLAERQAELPKAGGILEEETERFLRWMRTLALVPTVRALRERFERIREEELLRHLGHFSEEDRARVEALTRSLVNKLLHAPTVGLKHADPDSEEGMLRLLAARDLFALSEPAPGEPRGGVS